MRKKVSRKHEQGITLVELIVVISIIGILAVALGFTYQGWVGGYNVENQVKELYFDLMDARTKAMQKNRTHFVTFPSTTSYTIYEDTNPAPDGDGILQTSGANTDTELGGYPRTVRYVLEWAGGGSITAQQFNFNSRGLLSTANTIKIASTSSPDYDCVILYFTRINMGKWNGSTSTCDPK